MEGCFFLFYLVNLVVGYSLDNVDDVSFAESQWRPSFRQEAPDNYYDKYALAGNDPMDDQDNDQYPRFASMDEPAVNPGPNNENNPSASLPQPQTGPVPNAATPIGQSIPVEPEAHVIPLYTPPKNKHTEKEEEPYIAPEWQSDDGIADGRDPKIVAALEAITADLIGRGKELTAERKWSKQVESMLELYKEKVSNVHTHVEQIREEMKTLLKKKRQIENVEVQQQLSSKLRLAQDDLEALDGAMSHVQSKADEFAEKKKKLEKQIETINVHIQKLQHKHGEDVDEESENEPSSEKASAKAEKGAKKAKTPEEETGDEEGTKGSTEKADKTGTKESTEKTDKTGSTHEKEEAANQPADEPKKEEPKKEEPKKEEDSNKDKTKTETEKQKFRDRGLDNPPVKKNSHSKTSHLRGSTSKKEVEVE